MVFWEIDFAINEDTFSIDSAIGKQFDTKADLLKFMRKKKIDLANISKRTEDGTETIAMFTIDRKGSMREV